MKSYKNQASQSQQGHQVIIPSRNQQQLLLLFIALLLLVSVVEGLNIDFGLFQRLARGGGDVKKLKQENHHHHTKCSDCGKEEELTAMATATKTEAITAATKAISNTFLVKCHCGKVRATIECLQEAPQPLRLVCYCKDCRGYYNTLNKLAADSGKPSPAKLSDDGYGGVDWTCIYPRDITITHGKSLLTTCKIRDTSPVKQVYTTCCYTPMFRFGSMSVLLNTNLVDDSDKVNLPDVKFRIMGRQALTPPASDGSFKKPNISWSIPVFSWLWTMPKRINKDLMTPMPFDDKDDTNKIFPKVIENVPVLEGFQEG